MLVPVIMAGGVGSRMWPASRESFPKQFLSFSNTGAAGNHSLFQQSLLRLHGLPELAPPIVVCNTQHRFLVAQQLRDIGIEDATIILEPVGRNTAPAVALAALAVSESNAEDLLLVLAADHVIRDAAEFRCQVSRGIEAAQQAALVTFGIQPDRPETGYGYIQRGSAAGQAFKVAAFIEKPDAQSAADYLASGEYYWNSGMFLFKASVFLAELSRHEPAMLAACKSAWQLRTEDLDFLRVAKEPFAACPANSIDYAVMEKTSAGIVVPLDVGWSDLGAWAAVWELGPKDRHDNVCIGDVLIHDSRHSFVQAESRLVSVLGLDNVIVVETTDAVLVSARDRVQDVKQVVEALVHDNRAEAVLHRRVYRPWGSYESLASETAFQVKRIIVKPHAALSLQLHHKRAEHWIVVKGTATVTRGEDTFELTENQSTFIPAETRHRLANLTNESLVLIEVQCGSYLGEDDIERFDDEYGRLND